MVSVFLEEPLFMHIGENIRYLRSGTSKFYGCLLEMQYLKLIVPWCLEMWNCPLRVSRSLILMNFQVVHPKEIIFSFCNGILK